MGRSRGSVSNYWMWSLGAFAAAWLVASSIQAWPALHAPRQTCVTHLKLLRFASRRVAAMGDSPGLQLQAHSERVRRLLQEGFQLSSAELMYLGVNRRGRPSRPLFMQGMAMAFLCPSDPEFATKVKLLRVPGMAVHSSFLFGTIRPGDVTCPYHRQRVAPDGTLEKT